MSTPSEDLSRAADLIRDSAAHYANVRADFVLPNGERRYDSPLEEWLYWNTTGHEGHPDAQRWIALLSPDKAPLLETLLRLAAVEEDSPSPLEYGSATISSFMTVLRELARQIVEAHDGH